MIYALINCELGTWEVSSCWLVEKKVFLAECSKQAVKLIIQNKSPPILFSRQKIIIAFGFNDSRFCEDSFNCSEQ